MKAALAIMVKTPGYSPVKTRLAKEIGQKHAEEFFKLSVATIKSVVQTLVQQNPNITPYWSISEPEALTDPMWRDFATIGQGDGGLGDRLDYVYSKLLDSYDAVFLIGADSPQLPVDIFEQAYFSLTHQSPFVIGPTEDGGFYLFGGKQKIDKKIWLTVEYSLETTYAQLMKQLKPQGHIETLQTTYDVDFAHDLKSLSYDLPQFQRFLLSARQ